MALSCRRRNWKKARQGLRGQGADERLKSALAIEKVHLGALFFCREN
jgi:hypothetical protein